MAEKGRKLNAPSGEGDYGIELIRADGASFAREERGKSPSAMAFLMLVEGIPEGQLQEKKIIAGNADGDFWPCCRGNRNGEQRRLLHRDSLLKKREESGSRQLRQNNRVA